jgi:hypothetical protein
MATMATAVALKNTRERPINITSYMANSLELFGANEGVAQVSEQPHGTYAAGNIDEGQCEHGVTPLLE